MVFLLSAVASLPKWLYMLLAAPTCLWLAAYILPLLYIRLRGTQDLKKKYGAEWALVTGGSTGIGRAIAEALAQQGLNVVVQGLEPELTPAIKELQTRYASQQFVGVACCFAPGGDYLDKIKKATAGKDGHPVRFTGTKAFFSRRKIEHLSARTSRAAAGANAPGAGAAMRYVPP